MLLLNAPASGRFTFRPDISWDRAPFPGASPGRGSQRPGPGLRQEPGVHPPQGGLAVARQGALRQQVRPGEGLALQPGQGPVAAEEDHLAVRAHAD